MPQARILPAGETGQTGLVRTRLAALTLLSLTACSSGSGSSPDVLGATSTPTPSLQPAASASALTSTGSPVPATTAPRETAPAPTSTTGAPAAVTTRAPGAPAAAKATAPGTYTNDTSGSVTYGTPGTTQDATGTSTLTVSPIKDGVQHSTLHSDGSDTDQDLLVRTTGTYVGYLKLTNAAFTKEFRPATALLLIGDPSRVGDTWSWTAQSTDGKTTVSASNSRPKDESVTIGGKPLACQVVQTHLVLSGDVSYTADLTTWYSPTYRLTVKDHTVGKGSYQTVPFTTDITSVLRSVTPA